MMQTIPKCIKCGKLMRGAVMLTDRDENTFTQFMISYCPYCIRLDDKVEATCWARTEVSGGGK